MVKHEEGVSRWWRDTHTHTHISKIPLRSEEDIYRLRIKHASFDRINQAHVITLQAQRTCPLSGPKTHQNMQLYLNASCYLSR